MAKVTMDSSNFYAHWRTDARIPALQENHGMPPERLLQTLWQQQRLLRDQLTTLDGLPVRVLHPGFKNHGAGPDFRNAMIQIGREKVQTGDVEIDLQPSGWHSHAHDRNPAFKNVILHVIWEGDSRVNKLPTISLRDALDAPLEELQRWVSSDAAEILPEEMRGKCCAPLKDLPAEKLNGLLHQAAGIRWRSKAFQFQTRARRGGWEQALWEGLFRALGYKQNVWPMQILGELRSHWLKKPMSALHLQARLFGLSGLLPDELPRKTNDADGYLRRIWDQWWREREEFQEFILPRKLWCFSGLRPANHPQRRLALVSHWLANGNLVAKLEKWFTSPAKTSNPVLSLLDILQVEEDDFWSWHWTFRSAKLHKPQPLLGTARVTDLAINVILPWFWMRAVEGKNESLQKKAEQLYIDWPSAEDNAVFRLARQRLLGTSSAKTLRGAAAQQGLLQVVRDFCDHSNAMCENCQFPELVRTWKLEP